MIQWYHIMCLVPNTTESFNLSPSRGFYLLLACPGSNGPGLCLTAQLKLIQSQVEKYSARISCCSTNNLHFFLQGSLYKYWNWRNLKDMLIMIYSRPRLIWYLILSYLTHFCELTENKTQQNHGNLPFKGFVNTLFCNILANRAIKTSLRL